MCANKTRKVQKPWDVFLLVFPKYMISRNEFIEKDLKTPIIETQPGIVKVSTEKHVNAD